MFEIRKYNDADKEVWNAYVEHARNATFLLNRSYMDYHSDRFHDHSLMIFHNNKLYALLPANEDGDIFYSHQGLTYAGLLTTGHASAENICQVFVAINMYLKQAGFRKCIEEEDYIREYDEYLKFVSSENSQNLSKTENQ